MKRLFLPSLCALFSLVSLSSCQKEEESSLDLAKMLTAELQTVVDAKTAEAAAPRIAVINKRFQDAGVQVFALNGTALLRASERPAEYNEALAALARELGRVRASKPVADYDGEIDRDALIKSVGLAHGGDAATGTKTGTAYYKDSIDASHGSAGEFAAYYGSPALQEAITYVADASAVGMFTMADDVAEIPAATAVADDDAEEASDEPAAADEEPADEPAADDSDDLDIDLGDIGI